MWLGGDFCCLRGSEGDRKVPEADQAAMDSYVSPKGTDSSKATV